MAFNIQENKINIVYFVVLVLAMLPWVLSYFSYSVNADIAWLTIGAQRLLEGSSMHENIFETNPPFSILFHVPIVWLTNIFPIDIPFAVCLYMSFWLFLSAFIMFFLLRSWELLSAVDAVLITACYLISASIMASVDFGERDHVLLFALCPFILSQLSFTYGYSCNKNLMRFSFIWGAFFIMLKPHHGLLPTLLLCHRMIKHKKFWTIVKDPDFISLAVATVTYLLVCFLFFGDYIQEILPDVIDLYIVGSEEMAVSATLYYGFAILVFMLVMLCVPLEKPKQRMVFWFYFSALISLIPYGIQMKGYHYHLMPTLVFFFVGLFTMLNFWLEKFLSQHKRLFILSFFAVMLAYMMTPLRPEYPDHKTYSTFQITKMIDACRSCSSFFIFNDSIAITHPTSLYTKMPHASRFPAFWFLPYLISQEGLMMRGKKTDLDPEVLKSYIEKYRQMVAEDLLRYKPELLFIGRFQIITDNADTFNFIEYFSENEDFRNEWQNYKKLKEIDINQRVYFKGTYLDKDNIIRYDVYHRKDTR